MVVQVFIFSSWVPLFGLRFPPPVGYPQTYISQLKTRLRSAAGVPAAGSA